MSDIDDLEDVVLEAAKEFIITRLELEAVFLHHPQHSLELYDAWDEGMALLEAAKGVLFRAVLNLLKVEREA